MPNELVCLVCLPSVKFILWTLSIACVLHAFVWLGALYSWILASHFLHSKHTILSFSCAIVWITSVPLWRSCCSQHDIMQGYPQLWATKTMMTTTARQLCRGDKNNNDNYSWATTTILRMVVIPYWRCNRLRGPEEERQQSQGPQCKWGITFFSAVAWQ